VEVGGGRTVVFLGDGPIALLFLQVARRLGAGRVLLVGRHEVRLAAARRLGADAVIDGEREAPVSVVREYTDGVGADVVVECVGRPEAWTEAMSLARRGGEILLFGGCERGSQVSIDTERVHYDELVLRGGFHYTPASARRAHELIVEGGLRLEPLISERVGLEDLPRALERARRREVVKVAVRP
jgi:L-iditol 2-dehydrogenase